MSEPVTVVANKSKAFDINEGQEQKTGLLLPNLPTNLSAVDLESYVTTFERFLGATDDPITAACKSLGIEPPRYDPIDIVTKKAIAAVPSAFTYGRMSYMPDAAVNGGVIQWPGINPDSLRKVVRENVGPQLIIGMRVDDLLRYSNYSTHLWRPGWTLSPKDKEDNDKPNIKKAIEEARRFLENSNIETGYTEARDRDGKKLSGFQRFLSAGTRDSLTFDAIALWTDMDNQDKVKGYALLPAGNIRLCTPEGYEGKKENFAVAVDEGGRVIQAFTRDELTFYVRNPRNDPEVFGYGYPEVEIAIRLIKGFQNAIDLNVDIFDRSSVAHGILTLTGGAVNQRQLDLLTRMFTNLKKGITKFWALPVFGLPADSKLELVDLSRIKGNEAMYKEWMNMLAGALATLWRFPVRRLGYKISGQHRDNEPLPDSSVTMVDEDDPGLAPLLTHWECLINEYLIWTRWPELFFRFTGKSPKEDARNYEFQTNARSWGESRKESGLPPLEDTLEKSGDKEADEDIKLLAAIMSLCPNDSAKTGAFQTLAAQLIKTRSEEKLAKEQAKQIGGGKDVKSPGAPFPSKKDPAASESRGHTAGVRRNAAAERAQSSGGSSGSGQGSGNK